MDSEQSFDRPIGGSPKKRGALVKFLVALIIIATAVGIGYLLFLKNDSDKKITSLDSQITDIKKQLNSTKSELATAKSNLEAAKSSDNATKYYSIKSWGVKFVVPEGLNSDDIAIDIDSDQSAYDTKVDFAKLNTKQVKALDEYCSTFSLVTIIRSKQDIRTDDDPSPPVLIGSTMIDGYYYYYSLAQALCSGSDGSNTGSALESKHHNLLETMAKTIRKI